MIVLLYIGNHASDTLSVRIGWWLTRRVQSGPYKRVTHTESVLAGDNYKCCTIASSSVRDGGVRIKDDVALTKGNWIAIDVPHWDKWYAIMWFTSMSGKKYAWLGAMATVLFWLSESADRFFCNQATGAPFILASWLYKPCQFAAIAMSIPGARDVTKEFFSD